jgi:hypothetical protein
LSIHTPELLLSPPLDVVINFRIHPKIQFLAEIEFEHGTEEIAIETAQIDFKVNTGFNFRAGIVLPALGLVNTNHDSPNWEFVERPLSSTELIPTTLSEVGFGFFGRFFPNEKIIISYNAYVLNGLQDGIILNSTGRTSLASGKNPEFFGEDNNGSPALNGRISVAKRKRGEIGFSGYTGIYNTYMLEGEQVDHKRRVNITAIDFNTTIGKVTLQGELVKVKVDVPESIQEIYGTEQFGGFVDFIIPIKTAAMMGFNDAKINGSIRVEYNDYNQGNFVTNVQNEIKDEIFGVSFGLGFRPTSGTILRANYIARTKTDALGNPAAKIGGFQVGFASYF